MSSKLQLDVCCLSCCGGAIWWTLTKERQAWCYLQVKLCDPCLSALSVPPWPKRRYINTLPFLSCHQWQSVVAHAIHLNYPLLQFADIRNALLIHHASFCRFCSHRFQIYALLGGDIACKTNSVVWHAMCHWKSAALVIFKFHKGSAVA